MGSVVHSGRFSRIAVQPIGSEEQAATAARALSRRFAGEDAEAGLAAVSGSGLLAIPVPADCGGADLSNAALADVVRLLAAGGPSVARRVASHFVAVEILRNAGGAAHPVFRKIIDGAFFHASDEGGEAGALEDFGLEPALWRAALHRPVAGRAVVRLTREPSAPPQAAPDCLEGAVFELDPATVPLIDALSRLLDSALYLARLDGEPARNVVARETIDALAGRLALAIDRAQVSPTPEAIDEAARLSGVLEFISRRFLEAGENAVAF